MTHPRKCNNIASSAQASVKRKWDLLQCSEFVLTQFYDAPDEKFSYTVVWFPVVFVVVKESSLWFDPYNIYVANWVDNFCFELEKWERTTTTTKMT